MVLWFSILLLLFFQTVRILHYRAQLIALFLISSPEPKANRWAYSIGKHPSSVRLSVVREADSCKIYIKRIIFVQTVEFDWLSWQPKVLFAEKIISSEAIREMKLKLCRNVYNVSLYKYYVPPTEGEGGHCFWCGSRRRRRSFLAAFLSPEPMGGFWPNLHRHIIGTGKRRDYILVTFTLFSRSHRHFEIFKFRPKKACLHSIS